MRSAQWLLALAAAVLVPAVAGAQAMRDPTRPPAGLTGAQGEAAAVAGGAPVLQSVMISSAVKAAIISGELVRLGDKFGRACLIRISESEVVLREGSEEQVLRLYPGVQKSSADDRQAAAPAKRPQTGAQGAACRQPAPGAAKR